MRTRRFAGVLSGVIILGTTATVAVASPTSTHNPSSPSPARSGSGAFGVKGVDRALGNGLGRLLAESGGRSGVSADVARGGLRINQNALAIRDARGDVLVDLTPQAGVDRAAFRRSATRAGLRVEAVDTAAGTLEGFASLAAIRKLAALPNTGTISQALKPYVDIGKATSQGVAFQRINKVHDRGINGQGMTIGALSDSYNTATTDLFGNPLKIHAKQDIASGDLPGRGNPQNSKPVVVLQDASPPGVFDEGRAMLQIAHDIAPDSKLCFATAEGGEVNFANNIRALADKSGRCGADVVVDDIEYFDEPFFSDGIVSDAVDDVTAEGASYFSSAGNQGDRNSWQSRLRLIPAKQAVPHTNLDFSQVPRSLYNGGLQDMNPGAGVDVAQTLALGNGGTFDLQWNDPVDRNGPTLGSPIFTASGSLTKAHPKPTFSFTPTAAELGKVVRFNVDGVPSGSTDVILDVIKPDGTELGPIDTGTSPESLFTKLDQSGTYKIIVTGFEGATGPFTVDVREVLSNTKTTTDLNVLIFGMNGAFLGALADNNLLSGQPSEIGNLSGKQKVQIVISRAGTGPTPVTMLRYVTFDDIQIAEYDNPLTPTTFGHNTAAGATAVAAYDPFRPYLPEFFTSPGGRLPIFFDSAGNRFPHPEIRTNPDVAATDGGNTTFFTSDTSQDPDTLPNFFGTSAAAPHAASIAALLLQRAGGPGSLTPAQVRSRLEHSTFAHDLDPNHSGGSVRGLTITANGNQGNETDTLPGAMTGTKFFTVHYTGRRALSSITFLGETADPTALGKRLPPLSDGIVFDKRHFTGVRPYRDQGFPFTIGGTAGGLHAADVRAVLSDRTSTAGQFRHLTIHFRNGLRRGETLQFGIDRDLAVFGVGPSEGNGADELGGATFMPQGSVDPFGMVFVVHPTHGHVFAGVFKNRLGHGWTKLDGFGVINAQKAVLGRPHIG